MRPPNGQEGCDLRANRKVEERSNLTRCDGMKKPCERHDGDAKHQYEQCPSLSLPVECGETRQDRGILDAFLGPNFDLAQREGPHQADPHLVWLYRLQDP